MLKRARGGRAAKMLPSHNIRVNCVGFFRLRIQKFDPECDMTPRMCGDLGVDMSRNYEIHKESALKNPDSSRNRLNSLIKDQKKFDMDCKKS